MELSTGKKINAKLSTTEKPKKKYRTNMDIKKKMSALKSSSLSRGLGFNPLNYWFNGSEAHHYNEIDVIFIPKDLHRAIKHSVKTGKNMKQMNELALWFLRDIVDGFILMEDIAEDGIWEKTIF